MPKEDPFVNRAQLLKAIKKYPEIWDSNNKLHLCRSVTSPMWNEIAEQFGGHVPTVKLQSIWSQMKYHYHNLVHRQILHKERFNTKWEHFEPMSFMYNITVAKIVGAQSSAASSEAAPPSGDSTLQVGGGSPPTLPPPPLPSATHGRGRPSGSFSWLQSTASATPSTPPSTTALPHLIAQPAAHGMNYTAFTGLVPPAAVTVEATTTPTRKLGRPSSLHNSMRGRIIDAIKARPSLWAGRQRSEKGQGQSRTSAVWKEAAVEMGLTPTLMQTRWSIIKQRYVDELQKERHSQYGQQGFRSNWEHFERMSFMREMLLRKVDEREQTREHIQEMVSEQQQQQQHHPHAHSHPHPHAHPHHHQQQQAGVGHGPAQHLQLYRPPGLAEHAQDMPIGLVQHQLPHHGALHPLHPHHPHHPLHGGGGRRRVKHESDLEWDPFEMILHVQGNGEPAAN
ncbi:hypothetical protein ACLKA6_011183 [Drosophila palustris]